MKKSLKIVCVLFVAMNLLGLYAKLTHVPIQNPIDDVDLRVEGVMFTLWFIFTFVFSAALLLLLECSAVLLRAAKKLQSQIKQ